MNMPLETNSSVNVLFHDFINEAVLPFTALQPKAFWHDLHQLVDEFSAELRAPLNVQLQDQTVQTAQLSIDNIDDEIASLAGPQLVAPLKHANFALNASNARWGSLYDALRGGDAISYGKDFLDDVFPLDTGSHRDVASYMVYYQHLLAIFSDGSSCGLNNPCQFVALSGHKSEPTAIVLKNNGLHIEIVINRQGQNGSLDMAGIDDIQVEAALTSIMDIADCGKIEDKLASYRHLLGLTQGNLAGQVNHDKTFTLKHGGDYQLHGRSLLLTRQCNGMATSELMQDKLANPVAGQVIDTVMTALIGSLDLQGTEQKNNLTRNSRKGSIYMVKPKTDGPAEVSFTCRLFAAVEKMLALAPNTLKLAILDADCYATVNLKDCLQIGKQRIVFIHNDADTAQAPAPGIAVLHALTYHKGNVMSVPFGQPANESGKTAAMALMQGEKGQEKQLVM